MNQRLSAAAFLGATAVALGAMGAHAIAKQVTPEYLEVWKTAAHYHLIHALALTALAMFDSQNKFKMVSTLWLTGTIIFSTSLYLLVLTGIKWLGAITPLGGLAIILGWVVLGISSRKQTQ
jgi:uncharacterized membrane protein YgdD (TMEM256/DUF423 family)